MALAIFKKYCNKKYFTKFKNWTVGGEVVRNNTQYLITDNNDLRKLALSKTVLYAQQETNGHKHEGQEEVYMFTSGKGQMQINKDEFDVSKGDVVLIEDGAFHKVINDSDKSLEFICVFNGHRTSPKK